MGEEDKIDETQSPAELEVDKKSVCYYIASNFVQYHCQLFIAFTLLIFGISAISLTVDGGMALSEQSNNDLTVNSHKASLLNDALSNAKSLTDATATVSRKVREERPLKCLEDRLAS